MESERVEAIVEAEEKIEKSVVGGENGVEVQILKHDEKLAGYVDEQAEGASARSDIKNHNKAGEDGCDGACAKTVLSKASTKIQHVQTIIASVEDVMPAPAVNVSMKQLIEEDVRTTSVDESTANKSDAMISCESQPTDQNTKCAVTIPPAHVAEAVKTVQKSGSK
ncbi:hypothetical protein HDU97_008445 [Phlyctochytrium planicorne]|nr:hypothetical protein HDU97_008445 [Phlyctochytrium planicorne]